MKLKNNEVGRLHELADFEEQYHLLRTWVNKQKEFNTRLISQHSASGAKSVLNREKEISPTVLFKYLSDNDARWEQGDWNKEMLQGTASALSLLNFQCLDLLQSGDSLGARALAATALSEELSGNDEKRNLCLLADTMGYAGYAQAKAKTLPDTDLVKHYVLGDKKGLRTIADATTASPQAKYFYIRLIGNNREVAEWQAKTKAYFASDSDMTLPVLCGFLELAKEDTLLGFSTNLLASLNRSLLNTSDEKHPISLESFSWNYDTYSQSQEWVLKDVAKEFEANLNRRSPQPEGSFVDEQIYKQFYRATFNSAVSIISDCYLSMPEGTKNCARLADSLRVSQDSPADSLEKWLRLRIDEREGKTTYASLDSDLFTITKLGSGAVIQLCEGLDLQFSAADPAPALRFGSRVMTNIDGRPNTRMDSALLLENLLLNLHQSCRILQSCAAEGQPRNITDAVKQAVFLHSQEKLSKLLQHPQLRPRERLMMLHALEEMPTANPSMIIQQYQKLAASAPHDWWASQPLYQLLWKNKRFAEAANVASKWIEKQKTFKFLDEIKARAALAQALMAQGKSAEGLKALEKTKFSEQYVSLAMRALLLEELGKREDAETWATECVKRFPNDANAVSLLAEILWRNGKYSQAAGFLRQSQNAVSRTEWRYVVGKAFASIFAKSPLKLELAANSLIDAGLNNADNLGQIAAALYGADCAAGAFSILAKVEVNADQRAELLVVGYRYLKRWKNEKEALQWLNKQIPTGYNPIALAPYAFLSGQYELLWTVISAKDLTDDVAVLRAAALAANPNQQHKEELLNRYSSKSDLPALIIKHLLNSKNENQLFSIPLKNMQISKASFYVGWKSLLQAGNFLGDTDWYRVSIERGSENNAEYRWSFIWLSDMQLSLKRFNKLGNAAAVDRLHVVLPKSGNWNEQRRFGLSDH